MCNRELVQLQESIEQFNKHDAQILSIDAQEVFRVADWQKKTRVSFPILADPTGWVCAQYGVAKQLVVHDEWVNLPAAFVIDKEGILRYAHVGRGWPPSERATPEELLQQLSALNTAAK